MITESRVRYNGVRTRELSVPGTGTPIVLLHGYADSADTWRDVLTRLEGAGRHAFAVDLPGFGEADHRRDGPLLPQLIEFVDAIVAERKPVVLVGNSLGAATALCVGSTSAGVVGLCLVDEPVLVDRWVSRFARRRDRMWVARTVSAAPVPAGVVRWAVRHGVRNVLYGNRRGASPDVVERWVLANSDVKAVGTLVRYALQVARETDGIHVGRDVRVPTLLVHGSRDRLIPVAASRALHEQIPGSELVVLPKSGHCPQLDDPESMSRLLLGFVARIDLGQVDVG